MNLRELAAEAVGTGFLLAIVVGSGIMGDTLSGGNTGIALLANSLATGAGLAVLILIFGPVSGAHFNPAVSLYFVLRGELAPAKGALFVASQVVGGLVGVVIAHLMFDEMPVQISSTVRSGRGLWFAELVATVGLILTIVGTLAARRQDAVGWAVGLYITAAYWFTASTSFANPAVTIARGFTDSFAGIAPADIAPYVAAQCLGAIVMAVYARWQWPDQRAA